MCPEMVVVPAGSFTMGSPANEPQRDDNEAQVHVTISRPFAVGRYAVTRGAFAAFIQDSAYKLDGSCLVAVAWDAKAWRKQADNSWHSPGFEQNDRHPVVCVNWDDAKAFAAWLSKTTSKPYRLLSEAEREYVTRASTTTPFWWGSFITPNQANYQGSVEPYKGGGANGEFRKLTVPVDSFVANPWGLYQVHGNVYELIEDCWNGSNVNNQGRKRANDRAALTAFAAVGPGQLSSVPASRSPPPRICTDRLNAGFRLARTLNP
jgi:formylglycine-generating enzyme required for sulfatase activity